MVRVDDQLKMFAAKTDKRQSDINSPAYLKWREAMKILFGNDVFNQEAGK